MDIVESVRAAASSAGLGAAEIARRSGLSRATTYRILDGTTSPRLDDLRELLLATGLQVDATVAPLHDLAAAAAARAILVGTGSDEEASVQAWIERLHRWARDDATATVQAAGRAASVLRDRDAVGLSAGDWEVDRLVSAGRASNRPWALSGWASLNALGDDVDAPTVFWADDVRLVRQLLADSMTPTALDRAQIIVARGDRHIFDHVVEIEGVVLVDTVQAIVDAVGLGGAAAEAALRRMNERS